MIITVRDILELEEFKGSKVVAGYKGLDKSVNNALLMEVPDIFNYVHPNNFLITTLYPISDNEKAIKSLISTLDNMNLAGICIKPARYIKEIPKFMIEEGNRLGFPIIELYEKSNLSILVTSILKLSLKNHADILNFRDHIHESLMKLFLTDADINTLVNKLAELLGKDIILLDENMDISYKCKDLSNMNIEVIKTTDTNDSTYIKVNDTIYTKETFIIYPIREGKVNFGYLLLLGFDRLDYNIVMAIEQTTLLIASIYHKNNTILEKEKSFQDAFVRSILNGKTISQIEIVSRARGFGWKIEFPQIIMVIKVVKMNPEERLDIYEKMIESGLESFIVNELSISNNKIKIVYKEDSLAVFISSLYMNSAKLESIQLGKEIVNKYQFAEELFIGISNIISNSGRFQEAYKEAYLSATIGLALNKFSYINHFDDYRVFSIIKEIKNEEILKEFVKDKIGNIIDHDRDFNTDYLETIKTLIDENMNLKRTAEKLFIHYNTLRYRIDKLKEIGFDFDANTKVSDLSFAITLYYCINKFN